MNDHFTQVTKTKTKACLWSTRVMGFGMSPGRQDESALRDCCLCLTYESRISL